LQIELLFESNLASKFINFGANGVLAFQGVLTQIMEKHAPFMQVVHCVAH
jgi:hypothetical protein